jgi:L-xylulokinase
MAQQYLLGVDNGGTVAKAALFDLVGREVAAASNRNETLSPRPGWAEFDMERHWEATAASIRQAVAGAGIRAGQIAAVACTGHGNGLYLVDGDGKPVRNAVFSADARAQSWIDRWTSQGVDKAVRPKTMQALWPGQPNALLAWLQEHEPQTLDRARWILMCKDFTRLRLTGEACGEVTDMSGTSLMDLNTGRYDRAILDAFGIAAVEDKLPPIRQSADVCGRVTAAAADRTGLAEGTPVAGGLFDIDACGLASALLDENDLSVVLGTWSINQYVSTTPVVDDVFMTSRYCVPGYYLMLEGSATSASNLEWFISQFLDGQAETARQRGENIYDWVNRQVAGTGPDEAGILFLPFLYGSNAAAGASACLVGLSDRHQRRHVLRAVYEGVVFGHMTHFERLLNVRPMPGRILASGGAARSNVWMQILADVYQLPVEVAEGSELGALGASICAAVAAGIYGNFQEACRNMVRFSRRIEPDAQTAPIYQAKYARYKRFLEAMQPAWADLGWNAE